MKIITILGARPQFIKAALVSKALKKKKIKEKILHTGQHYSKGMSDNFFQELKLLAPYKNLGIGKWNKGNVSDRLGMMTADIAGELVKEAPDKVMVYGDTTSTLAGALAASYLSIPIAHVEAGLRSRNNKMPEERNRKITDYLSQEHFCPTDTAVKNLEAEGIAGTWTGDVQVELLESIKHKLSKVEGTYAFLTIHREENSSPERINAILKAFKSYPGFIVWPRHPRLSKLKINVNTHILVKEPLSYLKTMGYVKNAAVVFTDSGGLQKECAVLGTPCLTLRKETEWPETQFFGVNKLIEPEDIPNYFHVKKTTKKFPIHLYGIMPNADKPSERIAELLCQ